MLRVIATSVVAISLLSAGCGLVGDWSNWTTIQVNISAIQAPPQVEAGKAFTVFADYDAGCGESDALQITTDEQAKTITLRLTQRIQKDRACPAGENRKRISQSMTLRTAGTYRLVADSHGPPSSTHLVALPSGQSAPPWSPEPFQR